ncbi:MAG: hypothetical protein K6T29_08345 [Peptococcaceae bacterium]|nr:hypothetical protein [Peptococcaceae bacterium]
MKKLIASVMTVLFILFSGCAPPPQGRQVEEKTPSVPKRFEIIQEEGEAKNIGGFTVIRDNATGREYLVITGLNGAPSVINVQ